MSGSINPEIIRLLRHEGAKIQISGHRDGFSAALNTGTSSNPWWAAESGWRLTVAAALDTLLTDTTVQPEEDWDGLTCLVCGRPMSECAAAGGDL